MEDTHNNLKDLMFWSKDEAKKKYICNELKQCNTTSSSHNQILLIYVLRGRLGRGIKNNTFLLIS